MNLLQKQGVFNSIILYLGIAVGFFNNFLLQRYFSLEEIGFFYLLTNVSVLFTQLSSIGAPSIITRYFPMYKTPDRRHQGFPTFVILLCLSTFAVFSVGFLIFKNVAFSYTSGRDGASLMSRYYPVIIPVSFFTLAFLIQETFARANYKTVFPAFLREFLLRAFTLGGIVLMALQWTGYSGFINLFLFANFFILVILSIYNYSTNSYRLSGIQPAVKAETKAMLHYGLLSMVSGSALVLVTYISVFSLKAISGEFFVGIYSTFFTIAQVISLPAKALNTASYQIIADAWKAEDLPKISKIYSKTSVVQLLIGSLLLVGLIINRSSLLFLLHKPEFARYFNVFVVIGLGFLIDITGGLNGAIIGFSKFYKVQTRILIGASVVCIVMSYLLISTFGLLGAAISYAITMFGLNFCYWLFLKTRFGLQPFKKQHLQTLAIAGLCLLAGLAVPALENLYFDVILRSGIVTVLFIALSYYLNISEEINDLLAKVLKKKS